MKKDLQQRYQKPTVARFGTFRELTRLGCTAGGDGVWICRTPEEPEPGNGNGNGRT